MSVTVEKRVKHRFSPRAEFLYFRSGKEAHTMKIKTHVRGGPKAR